jgi:hypothetical protein
VRTGVVVLSGSSGRIERERASMLAGHGAHAMALGYFGGPGEPPGICEVPLETIIDALDSLVEERCERVGILGVSKGAEAALLIATLDERVDTVIGFAPTSVVWANVGAGVDGQDRPLRSSWMWRGSPLPFVPYDPHWSSTAAGPPAFRGLYEQSLVTFADRVADATIPVERSHAQLVLVAGDDDQVWPSARFATDIAMRAAGGAAKVQVLIGRGAGHRVVLPGELPATGGQPMARGGTPEGDAILGRRAWPAILGALGLD